jgi:hypothetical protein
MVRTVLSVDAASALVWLRVEVLLMQWFWWWLWPSSVYGSGQELVGGILKPLLA